jgi:hypothetical protein
VKQFLEVGGLLHVDRLFKMAIEEGRFKVNLPSFPIADSKEASDETECLEAKGGCKNLLIIQTMALEVAHCN